MANKKDPDAKFYGTYVFSLNQNKVRKDCYGKAVMIISTLLGIDHKVAEQIAADSGRITMSDINVSDLRKLQLVKICLNKAGVFAKGNELDTTHYYKKNDYSIVPILVGNDNVAQEAYYEAYKMFRNTYADLFHIEIPQINDLDEEDQIKDAQFVENQEQQQETKDDHVERFLADIRDFLKGPIRVEDVGTARNIYLYFRYRLIIIELLKLDPADPLFNILDQKLHGSKDQREESC